MHGNSTRLDTYFNRTLPPAKKYKNLLSAFKQNPTDQEIEQKADDIIYFFEESIKYLEENQKSLTFLLFHYIITVFFCFYSQNHFHQIRSKNSIPFSVAM